MKAALLAAVSLAAAAAVQPAVAQPAAVRPATVPTRDVTVRYQVEGEATSLIPGGLPGPVTVAWDAAGQRLRAEAQGRNQVALVDLRTRRGEVFDTALRAVLPLHLRPDTMDVLAANGSRLTRQGSDTVAGLPCTTYAVASRTPATLCLTADGVPLRGDGLVEGRPGRFTALSVSYGPVPAAAFVPPPGYLQLGGSDGNLDLRRLEGLFRPAR